MNIVTQCYGFLWPKFMPPSEGATYGQYTVDGTNMLRLVEYAGRVCYKSEPKPLDKDAADFVKGIIKSGHESVIEHATVSVLILTDRAVTHELVRHRIGMSYSQESQRYCNYSKDKFGNEITVVLPVWLYDVDQEVLNEKCKNKEKLEGIYAQYMEWWVGCSLAEKQYFKLLEAGQTPQMARSVLPNSTKTEIVVTGNLRAWRHFFKLRCSQKAYPQIRELATSMLEGFHGNIPAFFDDLAEEFLRECPV